MIIYSANELTKLASAAGSAAYKAIIRTGGDEALAASAYRRAYSRTAPPCWANLLPPPTPPRSGS